MSPAGTLPLLGLFLALRARGLALGVPDYLDGLRALGRVLSAGSREELSWVCQALWGHSPEEQEVVARAVEESLPRKLSFEELEGLVAQTVEAPRAAPPPSGAPAEAPAERAAGGETAPLPAGLGSAPGAGAGLPRAAAGATGAAPFDLTGSLPVSRREMNRVWRGLRRMLRAGPAVELDVAGTVARLQRDGVLVAPRRVPRRRNQAAARLLLDEGGSMVPFRALVGALVRAARQSGLARVDTYRFHDVPRGHVFREDGPVPLEEALAGLGEAGLLVVSDGGAARRSLDPARVKATLEFVERVRQITPRFAWLNPVPRMRWRSTTAEAVRTAGRVPMFPLDRGGLQAAADVLRGRAP